MTRRQPPATGDRDAPPYNPYANIPEHPDPVEPETFISDVDADSDGIVLYDRGEGGAWITSDDWVDARDME